MLIEKEVISPGTYWYLDDKGIPRKWSVTSDTTKQLHKDGNEMISLGLPIPIPFEHDFNAHPMTPKEKLLNNAGEVKEYRLRDVDDPTEPGGKRKSVLFSVCDIQDVEAASKIPKTIRWTSPWVSSFVDGAGRAWNNVIAHLALTTRPRVTKQAPFPSIAAAMAFALNSSNEVPTTKEGFSVSKAMRLVEKDNRLQPEYPMAFSLLSGIAMSDDDMMPPKKKGDKETSPKKKESGEGKTPPEGKGKGEGEGDDIPSDDSHEGMSEFAEKSGDIGMEELLADLLGALGIHLEGSVGETQFKRALYNAAMTKIHELTGKAQMKESGMGDTLNQPPGGQGNKTPPNPLIQQEQQPMYMSLQDIEKITDPMTKNIAFSMYNENVKLRGELDANTKLATSLRDGKLKEENAKRTSRVFALGRMSPRVKADLDAMLALPSMALSMGEGGVVVDPMAQVLTVLEKGLQDMPKLLTSPADQVIAMSQPTDADTLTQERADEMSDNLARMMGAAPEQKKAG